MSTSNKAQINYYFPLPFFFNMESLKSNRSFVLISACVSCLYMLKQKEDCITYYLEIIRDRLLIFLKGYCVLVRVEIIHKSKSLPGTVEKNSSTIRSSGRNRTYACAMPVHCSDH